MYAAGLMGPARGPAVIDSLPRIPLNPPEKPYELVDNEWRIHKQYIVDLQ